MDKDVKKDLGVMDTLVKNISKGTKQVIELKFIHEDILRQARVGNLEKLQKLVKLGKIKEIT